jgi:hypothetical protein
MTQYSIPGVLQVRLGWRLSRRDYDDLASLIYFHAPHFNARGRRTPHGARNVGLAECCGRTGHWPMPAVSVSKRIANTRL